MITLSENACKDGYNNGKKSKADRFGVNIDETLLENLFYCGGYKTITPTEDGFTLSEEFLDSYLVGNVLEQVNTFLHDTKDAYLEANYKDVRDHFAAGGVLFSIAPASHAYVTHSNAEGLEYSVLPMPKHRESQAEYASTQSFPYSMYGIFSQSKNRNAAAAFLQGLAEESYDITRPALIDKLMKGRYAEDPEDAKMWDYAINSNVFDIGRIFSQAFGEESTDMYTVKLFRGCVAGDDDNWANILDQYVIPLSIKANGLATEILNIPD